MASGGQIIWHWMNLTQGNFLDSLPLPSALHEGHLIMSTIISVSIKWKLQIRPPIFLMGGKRSSEKDSGMGTPELESPELLQLHVQIT